MTYLAYIWLLTQSLQPNPPVQHTPISYNVGHIGGQNLPNSRENWAHQCKYLIFRKLSTIQNLRFLEDLEESIPNGIALGFTLLEIHEVEPVTALNFCKLAIATAVRESTMNPNAKNRRCLGLYQIEDITANELLGELGMSQRAREYLFSPTLATAIYVALVTKFALKHRTLEKIFFRYTLSKKHAARMLQVYREIDNAKY